jgi:tetratricopeptide (TPR) repeat protein
MQKVQPAFDDIFNLDYGDAERIFVALQREYPAHPAPPLYLGAIVWIRELVRRQELDLDHFVAPGYFMKAREPMPTNLQKAFLGFVERSEALSMSILARNPADEDGLYFLASAYGIRGSYLFTVEHNLKAAFNYGKQAYQIDRRLIQRDPRYHDAYMTVGLYEYIVGSLPWYIKWLASLIGYQGSKERGFQYLDIAVNRGQYVSREAGMVRSILFVREGRYAEALKQIETLQKEFPRNYLFHLNVAQILEKMGGRDEAVQVYRDVLNRAQAGTPNYNQIPMAELRYTVGERFWQWGRRDLAEEQFRKAIEDPGVPERQQAMSHLRLGQILDLQGKRSQAIEQYESVLKCREYDNSHAAARELLKKPYRG